MPQRYLIERIDAAGGLFFSEKLGLDVGCPGNGWTPRKAEATRFDAEAAALDRADGLGFMANMVRVVSHELTDAPAATLHAPAAEATKPAASFAELLQRPYRPADVYAEAPLEVAIASNAATPPVKQPAPAPLIVTRQWLVAN